MQVILHPEVDDVSTISLQTIKWNIDFNSSMCKFIHLKYMDKRLRAAWRIAQNMWNLHLFEMTCEEKILFYKKKLHIIFVIFLRLNEMHVVIYAKKYEINSWNHIHVAQFIPLVVDKNFLKKSYPPKQILC